MTLREAFKTYGEIVVLKGNKTIVPTKKDYDRIVSVYPLTTTTIVAEMEVNDDTYICQQRKAV